MKANFSAGFFIACLLLLSQASAAAPEPQVIASTESSFGVGIATDGNVLVVGAPNEVIDGNERQGAVYVHEFINGQWQQTDRLVASDGAERNDFGRVVAVDGDVIVVSASFAENEGLAGAGKAYAFQRGDDGSWQQAEILTPAEPTEGALFGYRVAVDGNRIAVSSPNDARTYRDPGGAEYVFELDETSGSWQQTARVRRPRAPGADGTYSIAISGDLLATGTGAGTVFIWEYDGSQWREDHAVDLGRARAFVRLEGDVLAAALPSDVWPEVEGIRVGRVHVHERNSAGVWKEAAILESIEPAQDKSFGAAFDMRDGIIAASTGHRVDRVTSLFRKDEEGDWARFHEMEGYMSQYQRNLTVSANALATVAESDEGEGAINIFDMSEFIASPNVEDSSAGVREGDPDKYTGDGTNNTFESVIPYYPQYLERSDTPRPDADDNSNFGRSMDAEENLLLIGAPQADSAYVFEHDGEAWQEIAKLVPPDNTTGGFGSVVRLSGDLVAISAPGETVDGTAGAGAIHVYERDTGTTNWSHAARLVLPSPFEEARLGTAMDLDDVYIVANVPGDDRSARLFTRSSQTDEWRAASPFTGQDGTQANARSLTISDGAIALADRSNPVRIYENTAGAWILTQQLQPGSVRDVAMDEGVLVIGLPYRSVDERGRGEGLAEVFERGTEQWSRVATLEADDPHPIHAFGTDVDVEDGLVVIEENYESGGSYLFGRNNAGEWTFFDEVHAGTGHGLVHEVTVSALTLAIGLYGRTNASSVRAYDIDQLMPEDHALAGGGDDNDTADDGGSGDDTGSNGDNNTDSDTGDDDSTDGNDADSGDDISDDDADTVSGDDGDTDGDNGGATDGDTGGGDTGGGDTGGGSTGDGADEPAAAGGSSGGGTFGWLLALMSALATAMRRRRT